MCAHTKRDADAPHWNIEDLTTVILDNVPYGILVSSPRGDILYSNAAFSQITQYTTQDIPTLKAWLESAYPDPDYRKQVKATWEKPEIRKGEPVIFKVVCKDASVKDVEFRASLLDNERFIVMLSDVTERLKAQSALKESYAKQAAIAQENARLFEDVQRRIAELEAIREASLSLTSRLELKAVLQTILKSTLQLLTEAQNAHIFLYDGEHITFGAALWAGGHHQEPFSQPRPHGLTYTVAQKGEPIIVQDMQAHPLYAATPADWHGAIIGLPLKIGARVVGVMNVSYQYPGPRPKAEMRILDHLADQAAIAIENARLFQEVQRRVTELATLMDVSYDVSATLELPVVLERIANHARSLFNARNSEIYLLDPDTRTLQAVVALGDQADYVKASSLKLGEGIVGYVAQSGIAEVVDHTLFDPRRADIPGIPLEDYTMACAPLISKGTVMGVMILMRDAGQERFTKASLDYLIALARQAAIAIENARHYAMEKQRITELERALEQQRELDRLQQQLVQNVSHELRTPIAIIRGHVELLESGELGPLQSRQQASIAIIARRARMLSKLLDDLSTILETQTHRTRQEPLDLARLTRIILDELRITARKSDITLVEDLPPNLPKVLANPAHVRRVLDNLIGNALKFTPPTGMVRVCLRQNAQSLVLTVSDTGVGIPEDQLERIFNRFYQVDGSTTRRYGGMGVGLALVKELVESYGGQVTVESRTGEGSTFHITLPIVEES